MRITYECRLRLADPDDRVRARAITKHRVGGHYGGWPEHAPEHWQPVPGARVRWRQLSDPHGTEEAFELVWGRPERSEGRDRPLWRTTSVRVIGSGPHSEVQVTETLEATDGRLLPVTGTRARRPDLVADLVAHLRCVDGNRRLTGRPVELDAEAADEIEAFLLADRCLPVLLVTGDAAGAVRADAERFADELVGLAHTFVAAAPETQDALGTRLGPEWMPDPGGLRLFWPGWRSRDPLERHPQWRAEDCAGPDGPRPRVAEGLTHLVVGAATLWTDAHPLLARLSRSAAAAETRSRRQALDDLRRAMEENQAVADELIGEYQRELSLADQRIYELEQALEAERERAGRAEASRAEAEQRLVAMLADPDRAPALVGVLNEVAARARALRFLQRALDGAAAMSMANPERLRDALLLVDEVATARADGRLQTSFAEACRRRGLDWAGGVSDTAQQKYAESYTVAENGHTYRLGPHLRLGDPDGPVRVYCTFDGPVVVVGHIGRHLPDKSSPHG